MQVFKSDACSLQRDPCVLSAGGQPFSSFESLWQSIGTFGAAPDLEFRFALWQMCIESAVVAQTAGACDALVTAALMHRLGDLVDSANPRGGSHAAFASRARLGAELLVDLYPPMVTETIRLQPSSRRYLATTRVPTSIRTSIGLAPNCGATAMPMQEPERACFVKLPFAMSAVRLCRWTLTAANERQVGNRGVRDLSKLRRIAARCICNDGLGWVG
jgi:predicted HD phosphohydrolase